MSHGLKEWKKLSDYDPNKNLIEQLGSAHGIKYSDLYEFLNPDEDDMNDPYLLFNIELAVERIVEALNKDEKIVVFSDCDKDGADSSVIIYQQLLNFSSNVELLYQQRDEGHGSSKIIYKIPEDTGLFIAVDSSSNDVIEMKYLKDKNIDSIVIDHHIITDHNPYTILVNPQQEECKYPNKNACGALVVYKVCQVLDDYMNTEFAEENKDLVGFALAADMMDMRYTPENRYYFDYSLRNIKHAGLTQLFTDMYKDTQRLLGTDFTYAVSPAVSAAMRLGKMEVALDLLMLNRLHKDIKKLSKELIELNNERKVLVAGFMEELSEQIDSQNNVIILYDPRIRPGIRGLLAQEIMRKFNRPTIILGDGEPGEYKGSYRSHDYIDMMEILNGSKYALFGAGHSSAGGTSVRISDLNNLQQELNQILSQYEFDDSISYIMKFDSSEINQSLIEDIESFYRISGHNFTIDNFRVNNIFVEDVQPIGKSGNTVKIFSDNLELLKFKTDQSFLESIPLWSKIDAVGTLNLNRFWKYDRDLKKKVLEITCQLYIEDWKLSKEERNYGVDGMIRT